MKLISIFLLNMYGSSLWDLSSTEAERLWTMWNTTIRSLFGLHFATHRHITEAVAATSHLKVKLCRRFQKFMSKLASSTNPIVHKLFSLQVGDLRSSFGRNSEMVKKQNSVVYQCPPGDEWKIHMTLELLDIRALNQEVAGFNSHTLSLMLDWICTA